MMKNIKKVVLNITLLFSCAAQAGPLEAVKKYKNKTGKTLTFLANETLFALYGIGMGVGVLAAITGVRAGLEVVDCHGVVFKETSWERKAHLERDGRTCAALTVCGLGTFWGLRLAWYCLKKGTGRVVDVMRGTETKKIKLNAN